MGIVVGWWPRGRRIARPGRKNEGRDGDAEGEKIGGLHEVSLAKLLFHMEHFFAMTNPLPRERPRAARPQQRMRISYQIKMLIVTNRRLTSEKAAQLFRLARELEKLGQ